MSRSRILLVVMVLVVVTAAWWLFLIGPRRGDVTDLEEQRTTAINRQQSLRTERAALLAIQENELTYITAAAALERLIPATPELATFIDDLTLLAQTTGVTLNAISPSPPTVVPLQEFQSVGVLIDINGQFFEVLGFLYGLADMERLVRVDSLSLSPIIGDNDVIALATSIDSVIFTTSTATVAVGGDGTDGGAGTTTTTTTVPAGDAQE